MVLSMAMKMYISFMLHPRYNFYTPCIFMVILAYMTSMEYKLSNDITLWVLSVHITIYALLNQNWCIFHNFGVWDTF